jgi:Protein of unknown function (DUF2510)
MMRTFEQPLNERREHWLGRKVEVDLVVVLIVVAVVPKVRSRSKLKPGQPPTQQAAVAPGWYPDPQDRNLMRYFDGRAWTSATAPREYPTLAPPKLLGL